ncbi:RING finger protein B [Gracilariopsis chorda]|uniref:RING finger protein B n=1 Tax=Gracilariopsis chorda TaxID=448386 RepID=A0A2V3IHS2_9FLOR|nr:RING finger protein B [Gracilariopsis chorda]|eukprot:PXF41644.1 RING finger protein B [Gracilariopsis chorda]
MGVLNFKLCNFRLTAATPTPLPTSCQITISTTTRRLTAVESPIVKRDAATRTPSQELLFPPEWRVKWTERLPDRLAVSAAMLNINLTKMSKPRFPALSPCMGRLPATPIGALRISLLSLARGTVCQSLKLRDPTGNPTDFTLAFDVHVEQPCRVSLSFTDVSLIASTPLSTAFLSLEYMLQTAFSKSSVQQPAVEQRDMKHFKWPTLPRLSLRANSLTELAHSTINIRVLESPRSPDHYQHVMPIHHIWAALTHPANPYPVQLQLTDQLTLSMSVTADTPAPTGQMVGGVTTDVSITGARPVVFGTPLSHVGRVPQSPHLPPGWVALVDTFGYKYYHHINSSVDVWTTPSDSTIDEAVKNDKRRARDLGCRVLRQGLFCNANTGAYSWVHPAATRLDVPTYDENAAQEQSFVTLPYQDSPRTSISFSTTDLTELHPAAFTSRLSSATHEAFLPGETGRPIRDRIVEMKWTLHPRDTSAPAPGTEGHTLTAVNGGKTLLKFGGSAGFGGQEPPGTRLNTLHQLDVENLKWSTITPSGVIPIGRTGHGAVALGSDQSRLIVFGGSSPRGRLNDLHMFHVANETWSPVTCTGTPPGIRARMGMTVTSDGANVLVFGGRSLYRYLGGKYYDALYVNVFHAERSQWIQMRPRGSGQRPRPRSGCVVEFINDRHMFVHGGYDDGDRFYDDTFIFDMVTSSWHSIPYPDEPTRPKAREGHASTVLGDQVLVYGGDSNAGLLNDLAVFESSRLRWVDTPNLVGHAPGKLCGSAMACAQDEQVVLVGGDNGFSMSSSTFSLEVSHRSVLDAKSLVELAVERGPDAGSCVICLDAKVETMFLWCGHSVCCKACSRMLRVECPVCRKPFSEIVDSQFR